jgi:hypothetical protein
MVMSSCVPQCFLSASTLACYVFTVGYDQSHDSLTAFGFKDVRLTWLKDYCTIFMMGLSSFMVVPSAQLKFTN